MNGIDTVVKVLTESAFTDKLLQVHIGGADKADVDWPGLCAAHPNDAPVLDGTQEFCLKMQGNVSNLIQEERSAIGLLKLTHVVRVGISESALHVAE